MPIPAAHFVCDVVTRTANGRRRNRFYFAKDAAAPNPANATDLRVVANAVMGYIGPLMAALMDNESKVEKVESRWISGAASDWESVSDSDEIDGVIDIVDGSTSDHAGQLPDEVSLMIRIRTGLAGRNKRGRRFITGLSELINEAGEITKTDYKDAAKALANAMPTAITVSGYGEFEGEFPGMLLPRHYNRKDSEMLPITAGQAIATLATRRDRRKPLEFSVIP
jgi:hypothetical protein